MKQSRATLFGLPNSPEAYELRDFLKRSGFLFEWIDLNTDDDARRLAGVTGLDDPRLPACVMEKGSVLFRPTIRDLAAALDWFRGPKHERYDLAIYGAGPAGLSAAVYGASEEPSFSNGLPSAGKREAHPGSTIISDFPMVSAGGNWQAGQDSRLSVWVPKSSLPLKESAARREMVGR
jgi:hypothetical protein